MQKKRSKISVSLPFLWNIQARTLHIKYGAYVLSGLECLLKMFIIIVIIQT